MGATIGRRNEPEHRGAEHDPPPAVRAHRWNDAAGEIVPAEHVRLELGAKHLRPDIFESTGLAVAAIVEQRGEPSVRRREHMLRRRFNRVRLCIVEVKTLDPDLILETGDVFGLPRRGEHAPTARLQGLSGAKPDTRRAAGDEDRPFRYPVYGQCAVESLFSGGRTFCFMPLSPLVKISVIFFLASSSETPLASNVASQKIVVRCGSLSSSST